MLYVMWFHWMRRYDGLVFDDFSGAGLEQQGSRGGEGGGGCCRGAAEARELGLGLGSRRSSCKGPGVRARGYRVQGTGTGYGIWVT